MTVEACWTCDGCKCRVFTPDGKRPDEWLVVTAKGLNEQRSDEARYHLCHDCYWAAVGAAKSRERK